MLKRSTAIVFGVVLVLIAVALVVHHHGGFLARLVPSIHGLERQP